MASVGATEGCAHSKPSLGEIQTVADRAAYPVVWHPADITTIDVALHHQIFYETTDWIVGESGDDGSFETEAALQSASHVVLATAFPCVEASERWRCVRRRDRGAA